MWSKAFRPFSPPTSPTFRITLHERLCSGTKLFTLTWQVQYHRQSSFSLFIRVTDELLKQLQTTFEPLNVTIHYTKINTKTTPSEPLPSPPSNDYNVIFYIGGESLSLTNLLMTNASCDVSPHSLHKPKKKPILTLSLLS